MSFTTVTGPLHYTQTHRSLHTFYMCMSIHIYAYIHIDVKICIYVSGERERVYALLMIGMSSFIEVYPKCFMDSVLKEDKLFSEQ